MSAATAIEPRALRDVLGKFVTGVTVVTTRDAQGVAHGVTVNSFNSVSLDPPLVLWSQALGSRSFAAFRDGGHFAVNILADDQAPLSNHFARSREDKFAGIAHGDGLGGAPVLEGVAAHLECAKVAGHLNGDHMVWIGRVERIGRSARPALAFAEGRYAAVYAREADPASLGLDGVPAVHPRELREVCGALGDVATQLGEHTLCLSVWGNQGPTAVYWEPSRRPVSDRLMAGLVMPVTQSATGRLFAAFLARETTCARIEEDLRQFPVGPPELAARRRLFEDELDEIRARGMARATGGAASPLHGVSTTAFSVPLRDAHGRMAMALTLTSPDTRLRADWDADVPRALVDAALALSSRLIFTRDALRRA